MRAGRFIKRLLIEQDDSEQDRSPTVATEPDVNQSTSVDSDIPPIATGDSQVEAGRKILTTEQLDHAGIDPAVLFDQNEPELTEDNDAAEQTDSEEAIELVQRLSEASPYSALEVAEVVINIGKIDI